MQNIINIIIIDKKKVLASTKVNIVVCWGGTNIKNESYLYKTIDSSQLINSTLLTHAVFLLS